MAIKLVPLSCPNCGASIDVPVDQDFCYCSYCGTKIAINDDSIKKIYVNTTTVNRTVDEASIAETKRKTMVTKALIGFFVLIALICIALGILSMLGNADAGMMLLLLVAILCNAGMFWFGGRDRDNNGK